MKKYDKEKLNEYAKELFALCLEKGIDFEYHKTSGSIYICRWVSYICHDLFKYKSNNGIIEDMPIWELIEKVKQL